MASQYLIFLPHRASALDRWSDRAFRICNWQWTLAFANMLLGFTAPLMETNRGSYHNDPFPTPWRPSLLIPTVILPLVSGLVEFRKLGLRRISTVPIRPLCFVPIQLLHLVICAFLFAYNYVEQSVESFWLWLSFVSCFLPAVAGSIYALIGVSRFYLKNTNQQLIDSTQVVMTEYSDDSPANCPLEHIYQELHTSAFEENPGSETDESLPERSNIVHTRTQPSRFQSRPPMSLLDLLQQDHGDITDTGLANRQASPLEDQTTTTVSQIPPRRVRFRWQEREAARNAGASVWVPLSSIISIYMLWKLLDKLAGHDIQNPHNSPALLR